MRPEYLFAIGLFLFVLAAFVDLCWRKDWATSWLSVEEPEQPTSTSPVYEPQSFDKPAAKGVAPHGRRATDRRVADHQATVIQFLSKRGMR